MLVKLKIPEHESTYKAWWLIENDGVHEQIFEIKFWNFSKSWIR